MTAKRFDPHQLRDPGGEDGGQWVSATGGLKDTLKLAGKIDLGPGETLLGSGKVDGEWGGIRTALTEQNGRRMLRLGLGMEGYGQRDRETGFPAWDGNPSRAPLPKADRERLDAEFEALGEEYDSASAERQAEITTRQEDIREQLVGADQGFNGTAKLDLYSMERLASRIRPALAEAIEQEKAENAAWDEIEALEAKGNPDPDRLAELRRIVRSVPGSPGYDGIIFAEGIIPGSEWGDVHYSVELDDLSTGVEVKLGVWPKGASDDWGDGREWQGRFDAAEVRKFLRLLDKFAKGGAKRLKFDPHQARDNDGQWTDGTPGGSRNYFDLSGFNEHMVEVEGTFGDLAMGLDQVGDVRIAFRDRGAVRELDLGGSEVAEFGDILERLAGSRDDLPDDAESLDVYDDDLFGGQNEHRVELLGNGIIVVKFADDTGDPYLLHLDPPYEADPGDPEDADVDDVQIILDAIDETLTAADELADVELMKGRYGSMSRKSLSALQIKSADRGEISAVFCTFGVVDHDGDVVFKGAIPVGKEVVISAYNHASWGPGAVPVGKGVIRITGDEAILDGNFFMDTQAGRDTFNALKQLGPLAEYSWGFDVLDGTPNQHGGRNLKSVDVHEVSPVLKGASIGTRTLALKERRSTSGLLHRRGIGVHETSTVSRPWDAAAMEKSLDTDRPSDLRTVYAWVDPDGDPELKASYRFAHHHGIKGPANLRACLAGIAVLNGARGGSNLPPADRKAVYEHLASHLRDADREAPELRVSGSPTKFNDELLETLAGVSGLLDSAQRVVALRASKGKSLSKVNTELLDWIGDDLKRLDSLLKSAPTDVDDDGPSEDELASLFAASIARIQGI